MARRGRPPVNDDDKRSFNINVRLTQKEIDELYRDSLASRRPASTLLREAYFRNLKNTADPNRR